jgi:hypothetical protein
MLTTSLLLGEENPANAAFVPSAYNVLAVGIIRRYGGSKGQRHLKPFKFEKIRQDFRQPDARLLTICLRNSLPVPFTLVEQLLESFEQEQFSPQPENRRVSKWR